MIFDRMEKNPQNRHARNLRDFFDCKSKFKTKLFLCFEKKLSPANLL